jgi:hypothetical protein
VPPVRLDAIRTTTYVRLNRRAPGVFGASLRQRSRKPFVIPTPFTEAQLNAISDALRAGEKIQAIKLHREATGLGLKEAKDEIEAIEAGLREKFPDQFPAANWSGGKGCLGAVVFLLAAGVGAVLWWSTRA